ncbi:MAG: alpha/beta hydrolase [Lachnospiraceae bacterium]|nr:alpha/beta hydrolase [Lachnospiraceae bacterium]
MKFEKIKIEAEGAANAWLALYAQESYPETYGNRKRPLILICPGGGYEHVSVREGEPIALQFLAAGAHAAVLWYDVGAGMEHPLQLMELAWAVSHIREHADDYAVDKDKIIVAGFSAGGHLAASLGCFWDKDWLSQAVGKDKGCYKPNGLILAYPVITFGSHAHRGSFEKLMGSKASDELAELLSLEHQVTEQVPPVFMWHTFEDASVPLENSLLFAEALRKAGVSLEYHVFPHGIHGLSLATEETTMSDKDATDPQCAQWVLLCGSWLRYNF